MNFEDSFSNQNYKLMLILIGHPYVSKLTIDVKLILINMKRSLVKTISILLSLEEHNEKIYISKIERDHITIIQDLMNLFECNIYIH